ncbi:MAG: hypothetical protein E7161_02365 [Firmicutes bacterium]|nr:hypothetical protein [Bacillota bacterium]
MKKQKLLLKQIKLIANSNVPYKHEKLADLLTNYFKHCYEKQLKDELDIFGLEPFSYIVESEPLVFNTNKDDVAGAIKHLQEVIEKNRNGLVDGISLEEAYLILDWDIQNTRISLSKTQDITVASLQGCCSYTQSLTIIPLLKANLECTINNAFNFSNHSASHAFGTVKIPIREHNQVFYKQFLLDASYRQFFATVNCNNGKFYFKNCCKGPDAGYYVCQTPDGRTFATILLKRGFIELTEENAKIYGTGFECSGLTLATIQKQQQIMQKTGNVYIDIINNHQVKQLEYDDEELLEDGDIIIPPGIDKTLGL